MTPLDALLAAGPVLWGPRWQRACAKALPVDDRLVRRWVSGERPVPAWVPERLRELTRERLAALRDLDKLLR